MGNFQNECDTFARVEIIIIIYFFKYVDMNDHNIQDRSAYNHLTLERLKLNYIFFNITYYLLHEQYIGVISDAIELNHTNLIYRFNLYSICKEHM